MKLLLIEDSNFQRKIIVAKLSSLNLEIRECGDAEDALIYLEAQDFDFVMTDLNLPEMSGIEFIKKLKEIKPYIPVIAMTSPGSSLEHPNQSIDAGALFILNKPIEDISKIEELIQSIS